MYIYISIYIYIYIYIYPFFIIIVILDILNIDKNFKVCVTEPLKTFRILLENISYSNERTHKFSYRFSRINYLELCNDYLVGHPTFSKCSPSFSITSCYLKFFTHPYLPCFASYYFSQDI